MKRKVIYKLGILKEKLSIASFMQYKWVLRSTPPSASYTRTLQWNERSPETLQCPTLFWTLICEADTKTSEKVVKKLQLQSNLCLVGQESVH